MPRTIVNLVRAQMQGDLRKDYEAATGSAAVGVLEVTLR